MKKSKLFFSLVAASMMFTATAAEDNPVPVHRPMIEEYTGTWCGWCVRGLAGMELLRESLGDDFIGVAYHNGDPMQIMTSSQYPNSISGYPAAFINRQYSVDPLFGFGNTSGQILTDMQQMAELEVIAGIDVTAQWTSADKTAIDVNVTSYFTVDNSNAKYAIEVMLIADDLYGTGSTWNQANYYSGERDYAKDKYLGPWTKKGQTVSGVHFNDVLIGTSKVISGSLPTTIEAYQNYQYNYTFTLSALPKPSLVQNKDNLHVIAVVVNTSNKRAINANRCYIDEYTAIMGDVNDDGNPDIEDVTTLIDYILNPSSVTINLTNADVNGDENIDVADITALIDILLGN